MKSMTRMRKSFVSIGTMLLLSGMAIAPADSSQLVPQTPLDARTIPKYQDPMPIFGPAGMPRVGTTKIDVIMEEYAQQILPSGYDPTWVWAYDVGGSGPFYPGVTIEAQRHRPTYVNYVNRLPSFGQPGTYTESGLVQGLLSVDQTIHWADPFSLMCGIRQVTCEGTPDFHPSDDPCCQAYTGPVPVVAHLHGGEDHSDFDGTPDQWFTPADSALFGAAYRTYRGSRNLPGRAVYKYANGQEPTTLWFHDHALGKVRLSVYSGLAGFYLIRDDRDTGKVDNPIGLPGGEYEMEIMVQDRQFDTNGQWYFPDGSDTSSLNRNGPPTNPGIHPFWIPEFLGDAIVINGKTWPYVNVEPRRYRLRFLNASNARFFNMFFGDPANLTAADANGDGLADYSAALNGPTIWQIGTDGGLLDQPVSENSVLIAPAERADVIVDFSQFAGQTLTLINNANSPFPGGNIVDPDSNGQVMQFRVAEATAGPDETCNPATDGCALRAKPMVRFAADQVDVTRQLTLNEQEGAGGPVMLLLNNSRWNGRMFMNQGAIPGSTLLYGQGDRSVYATEMPQVGSTEMWELVNISADAHPIHIHLIQFQLLDRQPLKTDDTFDPDGTLNPGYVTSYVNAFPNTAFLPGFGPPRDYLTPNADGAIGGNPAVSPFLVGDPVPASGDELGWKDTIKAYPGMVTRVLVRFAPQDVPVGAVRPGQNLFSFDATQGPGYVWHCHILDHEDNEMMRPYALQTGPVLASDSHGGHGHGHDHHHH